MKKKTTIPPIDQQREALALYEGQQYYVERRDSLHGEVFAVVRRDTGVTISLYSVPWDASEAARAAVEKYRGMYG